MYENDYGSLIARWKVECIAWRAKRLGFRDDEIPDLEQDLVPELLEADFDTNGPASEKTFICRIIDHRLQAEVRNRSREIRGGDLEIEPLELLQDRCAPRMSEIDRLNLRRDLEALMSELNATERAVCEGLAVGDQLIEIARKTGKAKSTVSKALRGLREKMRERGIDSYLGHN